MSKKQPYCLMPWIHFHTGDDGIVKACCVANIPYGNINTQTFNTIWNSKNINKLRNQFAKGEKDKRCAHCYKLEETGGKSIRQETLEKFQDIDVLNAPISPPIYFDIRFSNICNYKCRTCWHGASSSWYEDAKKLGTQKSEQAVIKNITDFDSFISKMGPSLLHAKEIYMAGGEPLATEEHYLLLKWLIDHGATQMKLRYNTNFSLIRFKNHDVLEFWKHFKHVEVLASIDASRSLGEYIRKGMIWNKILSNRKQINTLPHVSFKIAPTISVLNVAHLPELIEECLESKIIEINQMYINILERPFYYNIQIIPPHIKKKIQTKYQRYIQQLNQQYPNNTISTQLQEILQFMLAANHASKWPLFLQKNGELDQLRDEVNLEGIMSI